METVGEYSFTGRSYHVIGMTIAEKQNYLDQLVVSRKEGDLNYRLYPMSNLDWPIKRAKISKEIGLIQFNIFLSEGGQQYDW